MKRLLTRLSKDTSGAVTADWVVLSAGVLALGAGAASLVFEGSNDLGNDLSDALRTTLSSDGDDGSNVSQSTLTTTGGTQSAPESN